MESTGNDRTKHHAQDDAPEPPPPGIKVMGAVRWAFVGVAAIAAVWAWSGFVVTGHAHASPESHAAHTKYQCPMHPQIVSDQPGECPICHMTLVPVSADRLAPGGADHAGAPGQTPSAPGQGAPGASAPPGTAPVNLTLDRVQSIGVRTTIADEREADGAVRVTATVAAPEQGASEAHVRAAGFVERIGVRETGVRVAAGQELLGVYSPEVFQAETEMLAAAGFGDPGARSVAASRQRLELLGMPPASIDAVLAAGKPMRVIPVLAPANGYVTKKSAVLGSYVTPEVALYEIVDLSRVYVVADVFQRDAGAIHVGTEGRFSPALGDGATIPAKVDLIYPQIDPEARTTRVRMQLKNDGLAMRPGQIGTVELSLPRKRVVVVPRDAVVDTGRATYVFVDEGGGRFAPRTVSLGRELADGFEVTDGVRAGERVVSSATFLVDSESRLQSSLAESAAGGGTSPPAPGGSTDHDR